MTPLPGDFGVVRTGGWQGRLIRLGTDSPVNHAFVYVGNGRVLEARPGGSGYAPVSQYRNVKWSTGIPALELTLAQRSEVAEVAATLVRVPYSWVDIAAIGLACLGLRWRALDERIQRTDRLICSQLVDELRRRIGSHLFNDGRLPCQVTPGDLLDLIETY